MDLAKAQNCVDEFFEKCFRNDYCFDARVSAFQEFSEEKTEAREAKFHAKVTYTDSIETKVTRHVEAFRNRQIRGYVREHPDAGAFEVLEGQINREEENIHTQTFLREYFTRDNFAKYLEEEQQPIRKPAKERYDLPKNYWFPFAPEKAFITLKERDLPNFRIEHQVVGQELALQSWTGLWYKVRVHQVTPKSVTLDLRGDPIDRATWEGILDQHTLL